MLIVVYREDGVVYRVPVRETDAGRLAAMLSEVDDVNKYRALHRAGIWRGGATVRLVAVEAVK